MEIEFNRGVIITPYKKKHRNSTKTAIMVIGEMHVLYCDEISMKLGLLYFTINIYHY